MSERARESEEDYGEEEMYEGEEEDGQEEDLDEEELDDEEGSQQIEAEEEEGEEDEKVPPKPLTEEIMRDALSMLARTGPGLSHAYCRLDLRSKELTDISLARRFIHIRYANISQNFVKDISPLGSMSNLLTLKADHNKLTSARLDELPYLQTISCSDNQIKTLEGISHPMLEKLSLAYNQIARLSGLDPGRLNRLTTLDLRGNKLESTMADYPPNIRELYLPGNIITSVEGLERLRSLTVLHLRDNQISNLDGFAESMESLQYINLRGNVIEDISEVKKLKCLPKLRALVLIENPITDEDNYRLEVLMAFDLLMTLERLDKESFIEEDLEEATELYEQRKEEEAAAAVAAEAEEEEENRTSREPTNSSL